MRDEALHARLDNVGANGATRERVIDFEPFKVAVMVAVPLVVNDPAVTVKSAAAAPAGTVIVTGAVIVPVKVIQTT